jgi:hypothetical protein
MRPLKIIRLHDHAKAVKAAKLRSKDTDPQHADQVMGGEDCDWLAISPYGEIEALLLAQRIYQDYQDKALALWWPHIKNELSNRGSASSSPMLPGVNIDGSLTPRNRVPAEVLAIMKGRQATLGYNVSGMGKAPYLTSLTVRHPELIYRNYELIELCNRLYAQALPTIYARQAAEVENIPWKLPGTNCSSLYLIKSHRCGYHCDLANLRGVMSCLFPLGNFEGGALILPRWRLRINYVAGDLLFFYPQRLHGNLPFVGERMSAILYCHKWIARSAGVRLG